MEEKTPTTLPQESVKIVVPANATLLSSNCNNNTSTERLETQDMQERDISENQTPAVKILTIAEDDDDDYDEDDDEEKENSQKLVIDISDDDEKPQEDDESKNIGQNGKAAVELVQNNSIDADEKDLFKHSADKAQAPSSLKTKLSEAIIILSDAEEDTTTVDALSKPGKIQKRKSLGAPLRSHEDETFRLKRRKINVEGAPKLPLTGYVRYMNGRRDSARKENPSKTNTEVTKIIGEEWQALPTDIKSQYLEAAEKDKKRYTSELHTFLKSRPDILASELAKNKKTKNDNTANGNNNPKLPSKEKPQAIENPKNYKEAIKEKNISRESIPATVISQTSEKQQANEKPKFKRIPTPPSTSAVSTTSAPLIGGPSSSTATPAAAANIVTPTPVEIPIFTNEFLEHNKIYDMELRSLRKSKIDLEQQNYVLEKHVENMKSGVEKMVLENNQIEEKNALLEIYLDKLKRKLANAFAALPLPNAPNGATMENIDKYMLDLYNMSTSNSHGPATLNKAKDIIRKLDLQINF